MSTSEAARADAKPAEVRISRVLAAPRERVFRLWTQPEHLVRRWGPRDDEGRDFTVPFCELDARPGGRWRIGMRAPDGKEYWHGGVFREVVEPERLVMTHTWDGADGAPGDETLIEVTLTEEGGRTRLDFCQGPFTSPESTDSHVQGWLECFDKLDALLQHG